MGFSTQQPSNTAEDRSLSEQPTHAVLNQEYSHRRAIWDRWHAGKEELVDLIYPPACRFCGNWISKKAAFCQSCEAQLEQHSIGTACRRCGIPIAPHGQDKGGHRNDDDRGAFANQTVAGSNPPDRPAQAGGPSTPSGCVHCRDSEFRFDSVIARWLYRDRVCDAVVACKFSHQAALADALAKRLAERVAGNLDEDLAKPDLVTFVPSHFFRQITRGGNGNQIFANVIARRLGLPVLECLRLSRQIAKQAWLSDEARKQNVLGAFLLRKSYALWGSPKLTNRHILLVDDVLTTGATANEVSHVLKQAGAKHVTLAVTARAFRG